MVTTRKTVSRVPFRAVTFSLALAVLSVRTPRCFLASLDSLVTAYSYSPRCNRELAVRDYKLSLRTEHAQT